MTGNELPTTLRLEQRDQVALLSIARPEKRNAIDSATLHGLDAFLSDPPADVRCVVLHSDGDHFSAGLDLNEVGDRDAVEGLHYSQLWHRALQSMEFGRVPVISVLKGATIGAGLEIASATHVRIAETSTFFALPEGQRGIFVGGGGSVRIPRLIGASRMMEMMLTGRTYDAAEGLAIGLVHYVVDDGTGLDFAVELAERVATNEQFTNFAIIHAIPRIRDSDPAAGYLLEAAIGGAAQSSPAAKQRVQDFLDKRAGTVEHRSD